MPAHPTEKALVKRPWQMQVGDDFVRVYSALDDDDVTPSDWTGWSGVCQLKDRRAATAATVGVDLSTPGLIVLSTARADVPPAGAYSWDLQMTNPAGKRKTWMYGTAVVDPEGSS